MGSKFGELKTNKNQVVTIFENMYIKFGLRCHMMVKLLLDFYSK